MKQEGELEYGCLSEDLIVEILLRLPVKSLVRFRCVSKSWLYLISDPWFAKLHHNQSSSQLQTHRLLVLSDSQLRSKSLDSLFDHGTWPSKHQLPFRKPKYSFDVAGSCNGLLCIQVDRFESLFIWNPSTGYYKQLPGLCSLTFRSCSRLKYGFGYDSLSDDYAVLVASCHLDAPISQTQVEFFSVATDSWTKCEDPDYDLMLGQLSCGLLSNGALHWLVLCPGSDYKGCRIIAYDLAERKFGEVPLPDGNAGDINLDFGNLRVVQGCLTLNSWEDNRFNYQIWIMRDYGVKASWTKLITIYSYSGIGFNNIIPVSISDSDNGEVVVMNDWLDGDLYKLNQDGASICCRGTFLYNSSFKGVYVESLLSLADPYE